MKWTDVCSETDKRGHVRTVTTRLKVPGGWIYRTVEHDRDEYVHRGPVISAALVFVPMPAPRSEPRLKT